MEDIPSQTRSNYLLQFEELSTKSAGLVELINQEDFKWSAAKSEFYQLRVAYKRVEIFLSYFESEFVSDFINGAPLPKVDRRSHELKILEPAGIQSAEEALLEQNREDFAAQIRFLQENIRQVGILVSNNRFTHQKNYEAMRQELIRIGTLGITGFDSPGKENALTEAKAALESVQLVASMYYPHLESNLIQRLEEDFIKGYVCFSQKDFDLFDRFQFIKDCINPLYEHIYQAQKQLNVPGKELVFTTQYTVNYDVVNIFDTDFLNHKFYSKYGTLAKSEARAALGKILFFDPILSQNNERACASCHLPELAFTDGAKKSLAFDGESTLDRNAPTLINSIFSTRFFHDMRAMTLEAQFEHVIVNVHEFNTSYTEIVAKLKNSPQYVELFSEIYDLSEPINKYSIAACISEYIASLRSFNSPCDRAIKGEEVDSLALIVDGFNLFMGKANCATCHFIPTFSGLVPPAFEETESEVLAVPDVNNESLAKLDPDQGRYNNKLPRENANFFQFSFKTPTVRNIALTAPYMHNGVFNTLEEVVDFYDRGGGHAWGIAPEHTTLSADSLYLSAQEKESLIFFMKSLTDVEGLTTQPEKLPESSNKVLNKRVVGGEY